MLELIRKCKYCKREMDVSPSAWKENPFCTHCLDERLQKNNSETLQGKWQVEGSYLILKR